jgi:HAMP domain-containing protein
MRAFFLGLRIRIKLLFAFGSLLLLSVLLIFFSIRSINRIIKYKSINEQVDVLKLRLETLDLACKEFMYEGYKSKTFLEKQQAGSIETFNANFLDSKSIFQALKQSQQSDANLEQGLDSLENDFRILVSLLQRRGFKDYGLEGELRSAIHSVENSSYEFDRVTMLMLRRHEKDFFLRKDLKYQDEFDKRFIAFRQQVESSHQTELLLLIDNYQASFTKVVKIEKQIGLNEDQGIRGRIKMYFEQIRPRIEILHLSVKQENETLITRTKWVLSVIFVFQIIIGIAMALFYSNLLTKSIKEIRRGMLQLADGVFPEKLRVLSTEEIGETKVAFNQFIDRLKAATYFAEQLGAGKLYEHYEDQYANDILAKSLITAQYKLRQAEEHQKKVNWFNEGLARFNDIARAQGDEVGALGNKILKFLISYLNINQGALYLICEDDYEKYLHRIATYAYGKRKFVDDKVELGKGQLWQCVQEGATIYLKEIPSDFVKITSGLGEATPRNVIIVPLKTRTDIIGVIELASFSILESHQIEFIEKIAESSAALLFDHKLTEFSYSKMI